MKHTPGPWITTQKMRDPNCIVIHTPDGRTVATAWNLLGPNGEQPDTPMEANARLIAAAPDLLHHCEIVLAAYDAALRDGVTKIWNGEAVDAMRATVVSVRG